MGRLESSEREQLCAFWREHLDGWRRSNLTQREYCAANGLSLKRFGNWEYVRMSKLAIRVYDTYEDIAGAGCTTWNDLLAMPPRLASITARDWAKARSILSVGISC